MTTPLSRRQMFSAAAAATAVAFAASDQASAGSNLLPPGPAPARRQVPGVYRWSVGAITVTAIADGYAPTPLALVPEATPEAAAALARAAFLPASDDLQCIVNACVVQTPTRLVMVDTGMGKIAPNTGRIWENLAAAGVDPRKVDALVLTHGHPDHISGLLTADGTAAFPNAELFIHAREKSYWGDDANASRAPDFQKPWFGMFQQAIAPYGTRTTLFDRDDQEIVPGVRVRELFGHTPGHSGLHVSDGDAQHLIWADIVHFPHLQFARPEWGVGFDVDSGLSARTRRAMLDMTSQDRISVSGMHLVFPGVGHVRRDGPDAFAFEPARWTYDL